MEERKAEMMDMSLVDLSEEQTLSELVSQLVKMLVEMMVGP